MADAPQRLAFPIECVTLNIARAPSNSDPAGIEVLGPNGLLVQLVIPATQLPNMIEAAVGAMPKLDFSLSKPAPSGGFKLNGFVVGYTPDGLQVLCLEMGSGGYLQFTMSEAQRLELAQMLGKPGEAPPLPDQGGPQRH